MSEKVNIPVDSDLAEMLDTVAQQKKISREEALRRAILSYKRRNAHKADLKKGYLEMGEINLRLAEMYFEADSTQLESYEEKLAECE